MKGFSIHSSNSASSPSHSASISTEFDTHTHFTSFNRCLHSLRNLKTAILERQCPVACNVYSYFISEDDLQQMKGEEQFERIKESSASSASLNAHRLVAFVQQQAEEVQLDLSIAILAAYFEEMKDIAQIEVLLELCKQFPAIPGVKAKLFLENAELALEDVLSTAKENEGPQGVPFVVLGRKNQAKRKIIFSGLQSSATFSEALLNLSVDLALVK